MKLIQHFPITHHIYYIQPSFTEECDYSYHNSVRLLNTVFLFFKMFWIKYIWWYFHNQFQGIFRLYILIQIYWWVSVQLDMRPGNALYTWWFKDHRRACTFSECCCRVKLLGKYLLRRWFRKEVYNILN